MGLEVYETKIWNTKIANEQIQKLSGWVFLNLDVRGCKFKIVVYYIPVQTNYSIILGRPWLRTVRANLDCEGDIFTIHDKEGKAYILKKARIVEEKRPVVFRDLTVTEEETPEAGEHSSTIEDTDDEEDAWEEQTDQALHEILFTKDGHSRVQKSQSGLVSLPTNYSRLPMQGTPRGKGERIAELSNSITRLETSGQSFGINRQRLASTSTAYLTIIATFEGFPQQYHSSTAPLITKVDMNTGARLTIHTTTSIKNSTTPSISTTISSRLLSLPSPS